MVEEDVLDHFPAESEVEGEDFSVVEELISCGNGGLCAIGSGGHLELKFLDL